MADQKRHYPPPSPSQAAGRRTPQPPAYPGRPPDAPPQQQAPPGWPQPQQSSPKPSAYWPLSVISLLCGPYNLFVGIVAIVFSAQVGSRWKVGDVEGARTASRRALVWSLVGIGVSLLLFIVVVAIAASTSPGY